MAGRHVLCSRSRYHILSCIVEYGKIIVFSKKVSLIQYILFAENLCTGYVSLIK